jgi:hypothetical protein
MWHDQRQDEAQNLSVLTNEEVLIIAPEFTCHQQA